MTTPRPDMRAKRINEDAGTDAVLSAPLSAVAGHFDFVQWTTAGISKGRRAFPEESPIAIVVNDVEYAVMLATPVDVMDFASGFLLTEGVIQSADEIDSIRIVTRPEGMITSVRLHGTLSPALYRTRRIAGVSSCGLCGVASLSDATRPITPVPDGPVFEGNSLLRAIAALRDFQPANAMAGAMHVAAFAGRHGALVYAREDVGRHNALDKLIGALARVGIQPWDGFIVMSSRCSYELIQKSAAFGVRLLCTVSAPTALAVRLAEQANMTLASLAREESFLLLTGDERIHQSDSAETHR